MRLLGLVALIALPLTHASGQQQNLSASQAAHNIGEIAYQLGAAVEALQKELEQVKAQKEAKDKEIADLKAKCGDRCEPHKPAGENK